jgi:hypothetical protein
VAEDEGLESRQSGGTLAEDERDEGGDMMGNADKRTWVSAEAGCAEVAW